MRKGDKVRRISSQKVRVLKALAQPVRLEIMDILRRGPACVCDLVTATGRRQPYISQQLIVLREAGLVASRSEGQKNFYHLNPARLHATLQEFCPLCQTSEYQPKGVFVASDTNHKNSAECKWRDIGEKCERIYPED